MLFGLNYNLTDYVRITVKRYRHVLLSTFSLKWKNIIKYFRKLKNFYLDLIEVNVFDCSFLNYLVKESSFIEWFVKKFSYGRNKRRKKN